MKCTACGAETPAEARFCAKCGQNLTDETPVKAQRESVSSKSASVAERFLESAGRNDLDDDEEEISLWKGGYSAKAMVGGWVFCAFLSVLLIAGSVMFPPAWFVLIPLMFLTWIFAAVVLAYRKMSVYYELTTQRFIHKSGILKRTSDRLEMIDIDDVTYSQGLIQRLVNVGSIQISSSDRTHPELVLIGIDDVREIADTIDDVRRKERRRRGLHIEAV